MMMPRETQEYRFTFLLLVRELTLSKSSLERSVEY